MRTNFKLTIIVVLLIMAVNLPAQDIKPGINMLKSAVAPGWGQLSVGQNYGFAFILAEVSFWSLRYYYDQESDNNADASFKYAIKYGGVDGNYDYDEDFFESMRLYSSSDLYNAHIVEEAAEIYPEPEDIQLRQDYIENNSYDSNHYWDWHTSEHQSNYSEYRHNIDEYSDYMKLVAGVIAANHLLSAFDALRISNRLKRLRLGVDLNSEKQTLLTLEYKF